MIKDQDGGWKRAWKGSFRRFSLILGRFLLSWSLWPEESSCVGSGFLHAEAAVELFETVLAGRNSPE
jgi:hypothetical protein